MSEMNSPAGLPTPRDSSEAYSELRELYDDLDLEVAELGPICQLSGRCCRFEEYGHTLFVSFLEVQYLLKHAPEPRRSLDRGQTCPWQDAQNRCQARGARPLGCRVYFCDPAYQDSGQELSERYINRLKRLTEKYSLLWNYGPFHRHLHKERDSGAFPIDVVTDCS